ncbi:MAG: hypothetical protein HOL37_02995 [Rhodospirillaceae bacterium]|jgi:hypothetical protein|nr:hypothetical protein [Rhodospirillaceae bacterium]MBT4218898.1 hypothetical protein [Rhodospirillaceae bacterium]MBT5013377.1 hypothetical protein [Rhodospirillaceae bacterium]MBT5308280.1 hypothetical protein [Rhodospirillaceae bacterium]MBT7354899.1 hypothetical protein [Rhodospirillaceae bacterium]
MIRQLTLISLATVTLIMATAVKGENLSKSAGPSFSSKLRSGAGQGLLPKTWPSVIEMRQGYKEATFYEFAPGAMRGHGEYFQGLIDEEDPFGIKASELEYLWIDVNSDGLDEVVVRVSHGAYCGSIGCNGFILERVNNSWSEIGWGSIMEGVIVGPPSRNGYQTLWFGDMCAVWNGETYSVEGDDRQDGDQIHPHACGKNYNIKTADATHRCSDCHE